MAKKERYQKSLLDENLAGKFSWIQEISVTPVDLPSCKGAFIVTLNTPTKRIYDYEAERRRFEEFILMFYEVPKHKHSVVMNWYTTSIRINVF